MTLRVLGNWQALKQMDRPELQGKWGARLTSCRGTGGRGRSPHTAVPCACPPLLQVADDSSYPALDCCSPLTHAAHPFPLTESNIFILNHL